MHNNRIERLEAQQNGDRNQTTRLQDEALTSLNSRIDLPKTATSGQAAELLGKTNLTLVDEKSAAGKNAVDFHAVVRSVDEDGYVGSEVSNTLKSQMGHEAGDVIAKARTAAGSGRQDTADHRQLTFSKVAA